MKTKFINTTKMNNKKFKVFFFSKENCKYCDIFKKLSRNTLKKIENNKNIQFTKITLDDEYFEKTTQEKQLILSQYFTGLTFKSVPCVIFTKDDSMKIFHLESNVNLHDNYMNFLNMIEIEEKIPHFQAFLFTLHNCKKCKEFKEVNSQLLENIKNNEEIYFEEIILEDSFFSAESSSKKEILEGYFDNLEIKTAPSIVFCLRNEWKILHHAFDKELNEDYKKFLRFIDEYKKNNI